LSTSAGKEAGLMKAASLRRVVLQFFSLEMESERETMVPLTLELVGCTQEQMSVMMRQRSRSQHLIAKTTCFWLLKCLRLPYASHTNIQTRS
jgi:hypothetical protein